MGMCLSHCGEAQHKAVVVAVSMSQQSASPRAEVQEPSQSLKRFLHLYSNGSESGKRVSSASLRSSLDESFAIPHSSELFSLPSEGMESDRSRSPSPSRGSISSSVCRSSTSSRALASPRGRNSGGVRPGRFSADRPPITPRGSARKVPARKSCSSVGQTVDPPHKNLVATIARLEKFCDVKLCPEKRSNSLLRQSSPELSKNAGQENSVRLHDSCRDLARKLLCFANEHACQHSYDSQAQDILCGSMRRCDSSVKDRRDSAAQLKGGMPLEKSVESFLKEVEDFVSKVDAASQNLTGQFTEEGRVEGVSRLPSLQFQDADDKIQFTDFEATFELCPDITKMTMSDPGLEADGHTLCNVATADIGGPSHQARAFVSAECETENVEPLSPKPAHRHCKATSDLVGTRDVASSPKDSQQEKKVPKNPVLLSVLTDISSNVTPAHDTTVRKNYPLKFRISNGSKRGVSRSLDLQDRSIRQLEFNSFRRERWDLAQESCNSMQGDGSTLNSAETQESQVTETTYNQRKADEGEACTREDNAVSQSADIASSESQFTQEEVPADGEERIQHAHLQGTESGHLDHDSTEKDSLAMAFDNLLKLLQSSPGELAQNTSELLELLTAKTELSADEIHPSDPDQAEAHMPAAYEAESWHDAPASLSSTEQPELHSPSSP